MEGGGEAAFQNIKHFDRRTIKNGVITVQLRAHICFYFNGERINHYNYYIL